MIPPPIALANSAMPNIRSSVITRPPASPRSLVIPAGPAPSLARILLIYLDLDSSELGTPAPGLVPDRQIRGLLHLRHTVFFREQDRTRRISAAQFQKGPRPERVRLVDARQAVEGTRASNFASFISGLANTSQASDSCPWSSPGHWTRGIL